MLKTALERVVNCLIACSVLVIVTFVSYYVTSSNKSAEAQSSITLLSCEKR